MKIATFQHMLEGYKVADVMAKHGAPARQLRRLVGLQVRGVRRDPLQRRADARGGRASSASTRDDAELARRLNLEAAKAVKYGGVPEEEALKFVTLNPAKQLRIDEHVGSLEVGQETPTWWSGAVRRSRPLSAASRPGSTAAATSTSRKTRRCATATGKCAPRWCRRSWRTARPWTTAMSAAAPRDVWAQHEDHVACDCGVVWKR